MINFRLFAQVGMLSSILFISATHDLNTCNAGRDTAAEAVGRNLLFVVAIGAKIWTSPTPGVES
jgi:hypothetical protein